jgi:hypothetical protein
LGGGEEGGAVGGGAADLFADFDEVVGDGDLGADVAELGEGAEEEVFTGGRVSRGFGGTGRARGRGKYCFQKEPGSISPISCSITAMSASVTSGMGAKKKITCVLVSHMLRQSEGRLTARRTTKQATPR